MQILYPHWFHGKRKGKHKLNVEGKTKCDKNEKRWMVAVRCIKQTNKQKRIQKKVQL